MYTNFYRLIEKPFDVTPDPRFLYFSETHQEALARLIYGINQRKGFLLLTGDVGTGKTTLLNALYRRLDGSTEIISINNPRLSVNDLYRSIYLALGFRSYYRSKVKFLRDLRSRLQQSARRGQRVLLVIDEAQALPYRLIEEVRLLSNLETSTQKLLNIFLVGQPELRRNLNGSRVRALSQRITIQYHIEPLDKKDTAAYIKKRLRVAGAYDLNFFSKKAIKLIYEYSRGYPRVINILCDNALISGFTVGKPVINHKIIHECARDINLNCDDGGQHDCWTPAYLGNRSRWLSR
jgi:general secretion pathway protein A